MFQSLQSKFRERSFRIKIIYSTNTTHISRQLDADKCYFLLCFMSTKKGAAYVIIIMGTYTDHKWSNFAIFGFIVQFDPWVGAHLWEKIRALGALETPQIWWLKGPPTPLGKI